MQIRCETVYPSKAYGIGIPWNPLTYLEFPWNILNYLEFSWNPFKFSWNPRFTWHKNMVILPFISGLDISSDHFRTSRAHIGVNSSPFTSSRALPGTILKHNLEKWLFTYSYRDGLIKYDQQQFLADCALSFLLFCSKKTYIFEE